MIKYENDMTSYENKLLERFGRENHFRTPDGYFENFNARMSVALAAEQQRAQRRVALFRWLSAAAVAALLISVGSFSYRSYQENSLANRQDAYETYLMAQIGSNAIMEYYYTGDGE